MLYGRFCVPRRDCTVQRGGSWAWRFHFGIQLWLGFHSPELSWSAHRFHVMDYSVLITLLLLSCAFTVHMNPPFLLYSDRYSPY